MFVIFTPWQSSILNFIVIYLYDLYGYFLLLMKCDSWDSRQGAVDLRGGNSNIQVVSTDRHVLHG
ncbi:hypothetical protein EMIT0P291_10522 [Pseudomonas sp. IT-P291]